MSTYTVEMRHLELKRGFFGYRRSAFTQAIDDIADSFEAVWRERPSSPSASRARDRGHAARRARNAAALDARLGGAGRPGHEGVERAAKRT